MDPWRYRDDRVWLYVALAAIGTVYLIVRAAAFLWRNIIEAAGV